MWRSMFKLYDVSLLYNQWLSVFAMTSSWFMSQTPGMRRFKSIMQDVIVVDGYVPHGYALLFAGASLWACPLPMYDQ